MSTYKKHPKNTAVHPTHASGHPEGSYHRDPHPSGKGKKVHNHRMHSGRGEITDYVKKER